MIVPKNILNMSQEQFDKYFKKEMNKLLQISYIWNLSQKIKRGILEAKRGNRQKK